MKGDVTVCDAGKGLRPQNHNNHVNSSTEQQEYQSPPHNEYPKEN